MFEFIVKGYGCNGAGESEEWIEYRGTDREEAIEAYKKALDWMGDAAVGVIDSEGRIMTLEETGLWDKDWDI